MTKWLLLIRQACLETPKDRNSTEEIEITPEMVEAGTRELMQRDLPGYIDDFEEAAVAVFKAMLRAKNA